MFWRNGRTDDAVPTLSFAPGFPAADFRDCGPSVFAYGVTQADADAAADTIANACISVPSRNKRSRVINTRKRGKKNAVAMAPTPSEASRNV